MRLDKIKLAGFKSFVDPTTVPFPSNLVGIVGPNGCGKSNVIDAVRWVMGESSAKMLRGESMADVIFNGSSARKPVGSAIIELDFDNTDGSAGGQYAQYSQISVKRQVSRDGQSIYLLNGTRCRRRDITDLFLGTGLGPRSYSIIEQGMISRVIEAKPEELRVYLEEAAGISKYKDRRRETENRIRHTRENLDRLNDLREEVAKHLQRLERQAAVAAKYQQLKQDERQLKAELLALSWRRLQAESEAGGKAIREQETQVESVIAQQRRLESDIERERDGHTEANDLFNEVQGRFYAIGAEVARLEQAIQFGRESRQKQQQELAQVRESWDEAQEHQHQDSARLSQVSAELAEQTPRLTTLQTNESQAAERLGAAERAMQAWQQEWDDFSEKAAQPAQVAQVERTRINHLEKQAESSRQRLERLEQEQRQLVDPDLAGEIETLRKQEVEVAVHCEELQKALASRQGEIQTGRKAFAAASHQLDEVRSRLQGARGRQASLEALQQAALGKQQQQVNEWLERQGLQHADRLAEHMDVEPGWQAAVETVMGFFLQAVCVDDADRLAGPLGELSQGALALFEQAPQGTQRTDTDIDPTRLLSKVRCPWPLDSLLAGVRVAENLQSALDQRDALADHESLVTRDGVWMGRGWIRTARGGDEAAGILLRKQELQALAADVEQLTEESKSLQDRQDDSQRQVQSAEKEREREREQLDETNRSLAAVRASLSGKQTRLEHLNSRRERVNEEIAELRRQLADAESENAAAHERLHRALEEMETLANRRETLIQRRDELRAALSDARELAARERATAHEVALRIESMKSSEASLHQALDRMGGQLSQLRRRHAELEESLAASNDPMAEQERALQLQLDTRMSVETELKQARNRLSEIDQVLRTLEHERSRVEQLVQAEQNKLSQVRMQRQESAVRAGTVQEQLAETGFEAQALFKAIPEDASEDEWKTRVEKIEARIQRLGPINLAAIDEFAEESERMQYLDSQHADVTESLETLENAIRKIDRETRTRFKKTYDRVNSGFQAMFPKLFGGGHAYLELTGEDLLDTGVAVMARPPGKRNSSIHLLSGGEKALTAVALVFSIFQLNPAPFCMLDEVDAPLDDANVGRFCDLVKEMSEHVQFIFITHNKLTMEIAQQLTGVTMHEPGVSRLVSVDVEEAVRLAAV
jgi:chromosome segregation protein